jgi:hypothetical protein
MAKKKAANKKTSPPPPPPRSVEKEGDRFKKSPEGFGIPTVEFRPPKLVLVGVEGFGKTSIAASVEDVAILMPETEQGLLTLIGAKRVEAVPCKVTTKWRETLATIDAFKGYKAIALDELSGFEQQCHEHVCRNDFGGDWSKFWAYHKGPNMALPEWSKFLAKLEALDVMVLACSHCSIETFKDPMNEDHDRYVAALHKKTWGLTRRWADACLFGTFVSIVDDEGKGIGGEDRMIYTTHRDTHDAKNRYGMPPELTVPNDPAEVWPFVYDVIVNPGDYTSDGDDADDNAE